jgi:SAM-dependent methyltransferase
MNVRLRRKGLGKDRPGIGRSALPEGWHHDRVGLARRAYPAYQDYLEHQRSKLSRIDLRDYDIRYRAVLTDRLRATTMIEPGRSVLCLAARIGTECKSFIDLGCLPLGIDVNPGDGNKYVVHGDFHALQFPDHCVDVVFTNSLDHAYDVTALVGEVHRVLKDRGLFLAEIVRGSKDEGGREPGQYESLWWDSNQEIVLQIICGGFDVLSKTRFDYPWGGDLVVFQKRPGDDDRS